MLASIIIPTFNRRALLQRCLQSLTTIANPSGRWEVIVVDDGGQTPLEPLLSAFRHLLDVRLIPQQNSGPAAARNLGAAHARGIYLAFTDDDCELESNWLVAMLRALSQEPDMAVGGKTVNVLQNNRYSSASQLLIDYLYEYYNRDPRDATFLASNNFALAADRFRAVGGFDSTFPLAAGEDREFCYRWLHHGHRLLYLPQAVIYHSHYLSPGQFWRQQFNYGRGACHFHQARAALKSGRMKVEPLRFYTDMIGYPVRRSGSIEAVALAGLMGLSQVANVAGFVCERWRVSGNRLSSL